MRRLLYGGSFDPIHAGHLAVSAAAARALGADRVCLVPAASSPIKDGSEASPGDRLEMCRRAVRDDPLFEVLDLEVLRGGRSYTYDTVRALLDGPFRGDQAMLLLGQDALADLPRWHRARELAALVPIAVAPRPGTPEPDWNALALSLGGDAADGIRRRFLRLPTSTISSTEIRRRRAAGVSIRCWVPDAVADYIEERGLYRPG
jgi:nicotinate-nucleotide adenylyltransferase